MIAFSQKLLSECVGGSCDLFCMSREIIDRVNLSAKLAREIPEADVCPLRCGRIDQKACIITEQLVEIVCMETLLIYTGLESGTSVCLSYHPSFEDISFSSALDIEISTVQCRVRSGVLE